MPQLNPEPWLPILIFTWLIFLTLLPPKILAHTFPNEPTLDTKNIKTEPWHWASLINS